MNSRPTLVVSLFDQKTSDGTACPRTQILHRIDYSASGVIRYCARLELIPGPDRPPVDVANYITRDGKVGAVAFRNFVTTDLAGMSRELELDARLASPSLKRPWIHGCISIDVSPVDFEGNPADLLKLGHALMTMFGVEKNRYMLAVHLDSDHIHVHFLYSRVDAEGRLRERERKMPKYMAEEAAAQLAYLFGYDLEARHLSRATSEGVHDLASGAIVRNHQFEENPEGLKRRNQARKETKRNEVLTLALVAQHQACSLLEFRTLLAPYGITYEKCGSGAEFVDKNGRRIKASDLDNKRRFTPTNLFFGALLTHFPETPPDLVKQAETVRDAVLKEKGSKVGHASDAIAETGAEAALPFPRHVAVTATRAALEGSQSASEVAQPLRPSRNSHDPDAEMRRLLANRSQAASAENEGEERWDRAARASMKSKPGRPAQAPIAPGWPPATRFDGVLGSHTGQRTRVRFAEPYQMLERPWQTEIWRNGELVASIRYSRMALVSTKKEDLREALLAAHRAWGTVEIYGKPRFKTKMALLAAELDIPISNPELQAGIQKIRLAKRAAVRSSEEPRPTMNRNTVATPDSNAAFSQPLAKAASAAPLPDARLVQAKDAQTRLDTAIAGEPLAVLVKSIASAQGAPISPTTLSKSPPVAASARPVGLGGAEHLARQSAVASSSAQPRLPGGPVERTPRRNDRPASQPVSTGRLRAQRSRTGEETVESILRNNWPVRYDPADRSRLTLYDNELRGFCIDPADLDSTDAQKALRSLYGQQQEELRTLEEAVDGGRAWVHVKTDFRGRESVDLIGIADEAVSKLYRKYQLHPELGARLKHADAEVQVQRLRAQQTAETKSTMISGNPSTASAAADQRRPQMDNLADLLIVAANRPDGDKGASTIPSNAALPLSPALSPHIFATEKASKSSAGAKQGSEAIEGPDLTTSAEADRTMQTHAASAEGLRSSTVEQAEQPNQKAVSGERRGRQMQGEASGIERRDMQRDDVLDTSRRGSAEAQRSSAGAASVGNHAEIAPGNVRPAVNGSKDDAAIGSPTIPPGIDIEQSERRSTSRGSDIAGSSGTGMNALKEKLAAELTIAQGDELMQRLDRQCPQLESKDGIVGPVDRRAFSDAELDWMRRNMLTMHRLFSEQEREREAADKRKEEARRVMAMRQRSVIRDEPALEAQSSDGNQPIARSPSALTPPGPQHAPPVVERLSTQQRPDAELDSAKQANPDAAPRPSKPADEASRQAQAAAAAAARAAWSR